MKHQGFEQNIIGAPGNMRRRQIAAIIAWGVIALCIGNLITIPIFSVGVPVNEILRDLEVQRIGLSSILGIVIAFAALILLHARQVILPGILISAGFLFLVLNADDFIEVAGGRSTIFLAIPVLLAAITIRPYAAFIAAAISAAILMSHPSGAMAVNVYAIGAIWLMALCIWLAGSIMERAIEAAQLETQRVRAMLGIVSHELRTPLGSISGYLDLMLIGKSAGDLQFEMLMRVKDSTRALIALVNRLLDSAHIQSGKLDLKPVPTPTKNIFEPVAQTAEKQAREKGLQFEADIHNMPDTIIVDALRLQQVISNLLDNAVKYTESGKVALEVAGLGNKMQFIVRDTGAGIAPEHIRLIFQEFSQAQHYATRDHGGVGLGLSIVHNLVNLMGGSIRVESKCGTGSAFIVTLPMISK
jgi:signal transduction histidine kinase